MEIIFKGNKNDSYLNTNLKNPSNSVDSRLIVQLDHVSLNEKENFGLNEFSQNLMNELDDVEGLLLARFFDRLADGLAARTNSTPSAVNRYSLPTSSS